LTSQSAIKSAVLSEIHRLSQFQQQQLRRRMTVTMLSQPMPSWLHPRVVVNVAITPFLCRSPLLSMLLSIIPLQRRIRRNRSSLRTAAQAYSPQNPSYSHQSPVTFNCNCCRGNVVI